MKDCDCTKIAQDEHCSVGYPSLLCNLCDGKGYVQDTGGNVFEPLAKALYEREGKMTDSDGDESWTVEWDDVVDSYPATYEHYIEEAVRHMYA